MGTCTFPTLQAVDAPAMAAHIIGVEGSLVPSRDSRYHLYYNATIWTADESPISRQVHQHIVLRKTNHCPIGRRPTTIRTLHVYTAPGPPHC